LQWLDEGEGKDLSLPQCPREKLEQERIEYLSAEQRLNYKVRVSSEGLLYWHRNGELVDTGRGRWKDLGDGRGIGEIDSEEAKVRGGAGGFLARHDDLLN
jgi:hypothetical protein